MKTTLSTLPVQQEGDADANVTLDITATGGDVDPDEDWFCHRLRGETLESSFNVFGDHDGGDFEIEVDAEGGGYADVDYPDIDVNWIDSLGYELVVCEPGGQHRC